MQIIDVAKDPYAAKHQGRSNRVAFEKLKRTKAFQAWREEQYDIQDGKCAYCGIPLHHKNIVVHIDHIQPLRFGGSNAYENLLLSCRRCNMKKWVATNRVMPEWVKERKIHIENWKRIREARTEQAQIMKQLVTQELDEQLAYDLRERFRED